LNEILRRAYRIDSRDVDLHGLCRPSSLLGMMQELATEHSALLGISRDVMLERYNSVWLVVRSWYRLDQPIRYEQTLTIDTWTRGVTGAVSYRDFDLIVDGQRVGEAVTSWVLADIDTRAIGRMSKMPEVVGAAVPETVKTVKLAKPAVPGELRQLTTRRVQYSDTDINGHMNNTRYVDVACDAVGFETMHGQYLAEVQVNYSRECFAGDTLQILGASEPENSRFFVRGADADGTSHFDTVLRFQKIP
jgi:acyl-ACP thioesterase